MQNLREAILGYRRALGQEARPQLARTVSCSKPAAPRRLMRSAEKQLFYAVWST